MYIGLHVQYRLFLSDFNVTWMFLDRYPKSTPISIFMKIRPVGVDRRTAGQTDMTNLIIAILRMRLKTNFIFRRKHCLFVTKVGGLWCHKGYISPWMFSLMRRRVATTEKSECTCTRQQRLKMKCPNHVKRSVYIRYANFVACSRGWK
jgi:hypothetical protein